MTYKKKLIEVALPLVAISEASARETSIKRGKPTQLHKWWAGRPLVSARAVLWASLVDDPSSNPDRFPTPELQALERERLFGILRELVRWEASNDPTILDAARAEIRASCPDGLPRVVDPFGGGGVIPLEAMRLGVPTFTGDLNPVAVILQRAMLEIPSRFAGSAPVHPDACSPLKTWNGAQGLAADVEAYGRRLRDIAEERVGHLYRLGLDEKGRVPITWIWARTVKSPDPAWPGHVPLVRSWVLSKKSGRSVVWVEPVVDESDKFIKYTVRSGGSPIEGTVDRGKGRCIATGTLISNDYIIDEATHGRMGSVCIAVVLSGNRCKEYGEPDDSIVGLADLMRPSGVIEGSLFPHKKSITVPLYGMNRWEDLFTTRQLLTLAGFSDALVPLRIEIVKDALAAGLDTDPARLRDHGRGAEAYGDAIITYLALAIDRLADWNNMLCPWEKNAEVSQQLFGRQAIPMVWDYAEANPFAESTGSMIATLKTLRTALEVLPDLSGIAVDIQQRDASARLKEIGTCTLATDPPYYGQIPYADLSDFFYAWMRKNLRSIWPDECATLATPKADELIANQYRAGSIKAARDHFEGGMRKTFSVAAGVCDERFPATIYYAFKASESDESGATSTGWETFLQGLLDGGWTVTATWPIRTENRTRRVALGTNSLASSVVLACRPREVAASMATRGEFANALRLEMEPAVRLLQVENIAPVDLAQSAMGPGIAIFSRYAKVVEADGSAMSVRTALSLINEVLDEVLSGEESEFDADTRFALTWFQQFGHNPGPFGDSDLLARAKDTTVLGVVQSGIVASRDGKVRLLERHELSHDWDPMRDDRLTVWETTQYLIRGLDSSEREAAALLGRLGHGVGDRARQLAYLLYGMCERKKWPDEAGAYNMLVTAWPEISRLAAAGPVQDSTGSLF